MGELSNNLFPVFGGGMGRFKNYTSEDQNKNRKTSLCINWFLMSENNGRDGGVHGILKNYTTYDPRDPWWCNYLDIIV